MALRNSMRLFGLRLAKLRDYHWVSERSIYPIARVERTEHPDLGHIWEASVSFSCGARLHRTGPTKRAALENIRRSARDLSSELSELLK